MVRVDLFAEDSAHEQFCPALIERLAATLGMHATVRVRSSRGGIPEAESQLRAYLRAIEKGLIHSPDLLCVAIDANCLGHAARKKHLQPMINPQVVAHAAFMCPDPHVERWYMADPQCFERVVGSGPAQLAAKCDRATYKMQMREAVVRGGHKSTLDGVEFGEELANTMELFRAGKNVRSLSAAVSDVRAHLKQLRAIGL